MSRNFEEIRLRNQELTEKLLRLSGNTLAPETDAAPGLVPADADAIVAHIEINDHHGVGVLLLRLFGEHPNLISIRSRDYYSGRQNFGAMHACIAHGDTRRDAVMWNVLQAMEGATVRRVLAVPYFADDAINAIALKELFGA